VEAGGGAAGAGYDDDRAFQRFRKGAIRYLVRDPALTLLQPGSEQCRGGEMISFPATVQLTVAGRATIWALCLSGWVPATCGSVWRKSAAT